MENFEKVQYPQPSETPGHRVSGKTYFAISPAPPDFIIQNTSISYQIDAEKEYVDVILLEEYVGIEGLWAKIVYDGAVGYVLQDSIKRIDNTILPSIEPKIIKEYLADSLYPSINWKNEKSNSLINDNRRGLYSVIYDTTVEYIQPGTMPSILENGLYEGLSIILKELGKQFDIEYVKNLQKSFYIFGKVEAIDFYFRNCSTLRILVSLPKVYAHSNLVKKNTNDLWETPEDPEDPEAEPTPENPTVGVGGGNTVHTPAPDPTNPDTGGTGGGTGTTNPSPEKPVVFDTTKKQKYIDVLFANYKEYETFFNDIDGMLEISEKIYNQYQWSVDPNYIDLNMTRERSNLRNLKNKISELIFRNLPKNRALLDEVFNGIFSAKDVSFNPYLVAPEDFHWEGRLVIRFNPDDLSIVSMNYKTPVTKRRLKFTKGVSNFLEDPLINNPTSVNYVLRRHLSLCKSHVVSSMRQEILKKTIQIIKSKRSGSEKSIFETAKEIYSAIKDGKLTQFAAEQSPEEVIAILSYIGQLDIYNISAAQAAPIRLIVKQKLKKYKTVFAYDPYNKEIDNLSPSNVEMDEFLSPYATGYSFGYSTLIVPLVGATVVGIANVAILAADLITLNFFFSQETELINFGPGNDLSNFLTKFHFPKVNSLEMMDIDAINCLASNYSSFQKIVAKGKAIYRQDWSEKYKEREQQLLEKETNAFIQGLKNFFQIRDANLRIVLLRDEPPAPPAGTKIKALYEFNDWWLPAFKQTDIATILMDCLKCAVANMDPATLSKLMNDYKNAKKLINQFLASTLCNPFLTGLLGKLAALEIPDFFTYDPNENLANMLINFIVDLAKKALVMTVRAILNACFNNCLEDKNKEKSLGAAPIQDPLLNATDDSNVDDILADLGLYDPTAYLPLEPFVGTEILSKLSPPPPSPPSGTGNSQTGESSTDAATREYNKNAARTAAKEKVKNFISDLTCILTAKEICSLLKGESVSLEVYEIIRTIAKAKHPDLANKLNTYEQIAVLFKRLGINLDTTICDEIENSQNPIPINCSCDDGSVEKARRDILSGVEIPIGQSFEAPLPFIPDNLVPPPEGKPISGSGANPGKGLTNDEVAAILEEQKSNEEKAVKDILKFLDSPNIFDPQKLPPALCVIRPDGSVVPPAFNLNPPLESFKSMINSLAEPVYKTFDSEATSWPLTTFSYEQPLETKQLFKFENGQLNLDQGKLQDILNKAKDNAKNEQDSSATTTETKTTPITHPAYLFNELLSSSLIYEFPYTDDEIKNKKRNLKFNLNSKEYLLGTKELNLNTTAVIGTLRDDVSSFNAYLSSFNFTFLTKFQDKIKDLLRNPENSNKKSSELYNILLTNSGVSSNFPRDPNYLNYFYLNTSIQPSSFWKQFFPNSSESFRASIKETGFSLSDKIMKIISSFSNRDFQAILNYINYSDFNLNDLFTRWKKVSVYYNNINNTLNIYPNYEVNYKESLYYGDMYNLQILKNKNQFINIQNTDQSKEIVDIINTEIKNKLGKDNFEEALAQSDKDALFPTTLKMSLSKQDLFTYLAGNQFTSQDFKDISNIFFNSIQKMTYDSLFLKEYEVSHTTASFIEYKLADKTKYKMVPESYSFSTITQLLTLKLEGIPTAAQKACGVYPHFLDIDLLKDEATAAKKQSVCIEEAINNKIRQNQPVTSKELQHVELNDTQMILLNLAHQLTLRVYITDILLRGTGIFGICDPQIFRNDSLFVKFISSLVESEIKGVDINYYDIMTLFFIKKHNIEYPTDILDITEENKRKVLQDMIQYTLKFSSLPKLSKRIIEDTNKVLVDKKINKLKGQKELPNNSFYQFNLKYFNKLDDINQIFQYSNGQLSIENGIFKYKNLKTNIVKTFKIAENNNLSDSDSKFKYLFEFLFPVKKYFIYLFICNVMGTSTRRTIFDAFLSTKSSARNLCKKMQSSGQPIVPDVNDPQDMQNDQNLSVIGFIIKALIETPPKIVKSFIEGVDPNVKLSSFAYIVGRIFKEDFPDTIKPLIGVPLMACVFTPFMFNPLNVVYYSAGMWREEKNDSQDAKNRAILDNLLFSKGPEDMICGDPLTKFHDDIVLLGNKDNKLDENGYYYKDVNKNIIKIKIQEATEQIKKEEEAAAEEDVEDSLE